MITVHHLERSRSERVLWLLEELGLNYDIVRYPRDPVTNLAPQQLRAVHPLGKSPVVTDGAEVLAESGAIVETLIERHDPEGRLVPPAGTPERTRYRYWLHFAEGSMAPPLVMNFLVDPKGEGADKLRAYVRDQFRLQLDHIEAELGRSDYFAGDRFSGADVMMARHLKRLNDLDAAVPRPRIAAYLGRVEARPAFQRAMAKASG